MPLSATAVQKLFVGTLDRAASAAELSTYQAYTDINQVGIALYKLPEAQTLFNPNATLNSFVTAAYEQIFNRAPDSGGLVYWVGQVGSGAVPRDQLIIALVNGAQDVSTTTPPTFDLSLLTNKAIAANYFTEHAGGVATFSVAAATDIINPVTYIATSIPASEALSDHYAAGGAVDTFTLTTGIDKIMATGGGSHIDAIDSGTAPTWTGLDTITATGTNNVFNVSTSLALSNPGGTTVTGVQTMNVVESANQTVTLDTTAFTGLTQLTVTNSGTSAVTLTAAATNNVNVTGSNTTNAVTTVNGGNAVTVTTINGTVAVGHATVGTGTGASPAGAIVVTETGTAGNNISVYGGTSVNVTATGVTTGGTITVGSAAVAPTGVVTISSTAVNATAQTSDAINVIGGSTVNVTSLASSTGAAGTKTSTVGDIAVTGTATTTAVTVTQQAAILAAAAVANNANTSNAVDAYNGVTNGVVTIADKNAASLTAAATITSVTLANYANSTISSNALTSLTLSAATGTGSIAAGTLGVTYGLTTGNPTSLALNLGGGSLGALTLGGNLVTTVTTTLTADTTLAAITDTGLRTLTVAGTGVLTYTTPNTALTSLTLSGAAGLNADISSLRGITALTAANTTGAVTVTLNAATQAFTGGAGRDIVTIGVNATKVITGGSGLTDRLNLSATAATYLAATNTNVTGFEQLFVSNAGGGTYDMSKFTGFNVVGVNAATGSTNTFTKVAVGTALNVEVAGNTVIYQGVSGVTSVAVNLVGTAVTAANGGGTAGFTTTALTLQDVNLAGLGTVTINSDASVYQGLHTIATLTDISLSNLTITGTGSLSIGATAATATTATALTIADNGTGTSTTADGFIALTSTGDILGAINYSGTHNFTIASLVDNVPNLTITNANTGTTGVLTVTSHSAAALTSLTLSGAVALTGVYAVAGAITVSGATDHQAVSLTMSGIGIHTVTLGNGANTIISGSAADVITVGTGANSITAGAGADTIVLGAHAGVVDTFIYTAANQGGATTTITAGTALAAGDTIGATGTSFLVANDLININAAGATSGAAHAAAAGTLLDSWNLNTNSIFINTLTTLAGAAPTAANVAALIGKVTTTATTDSAMVAIQTDAASNVWDLFQVTSTSAAHSAAILATTDTISLVGTFTTNGALTTANFVA